MKLNKRSLTVIAMTLVAVSAFFVMVGSYLFINKPSIPAEMRKGGN